MPKRKGTTSNRSKVPKRGGAGIGFKNLGANLKAKAQGAIGNVQAKAKGMVDNAKSQAASAINDANPIAAAQNAIEGGISDIKSGATDGTFVAGVDSIKDGADLDIKFKKAQQIERLVDQVKKIAQMPIRVAWWFNAMPYIVLFLVCFLLYILIKGPAGSPLSSAVGGISSTTSEAYNTTKGFFAKAFGWLTVFWAKLRSFMTPNYRVQMFFRSISPFQGSIPSVPRQQMMSGRCDNLRWIDSSTEGTAGYCLSSVRPNDFIWNLDISKMPEYFELPLERRMQLTPKMRIRIPYVRGDPNAKDTFFIPDCKNATFVDVIDPVTKKEVPAPLFEDTGMMCKLKELPSSLFTAKTRGEGEDLTVAFR